MKFPNIASFLKSATTNINIASATAPSNWQVLTATSSTTATWQTHNAWWWASTQSTFVAWEDLVVWNLGCQPKYLVSTTQQLTWNNFNDWNTHSHWQTITVSWNILKDFTWYFWSAYTVTSNIQMQIYSSVWWTLLWT